MDETTVGIEQSYLEKLGIIAKKAKRSKIQQVHFLIDQEIESSKERKL